MTKFLIIRFSSIGDIVLTTPVIRNLKEQFAGAELHYLTKKSFAPLLADNPYIDKIHLLDKSLSDIIPQLKKESFDYIIDLHHNLRSLIIRHKLKIKTFSFNKLNWQKWLMVHFKINKLPEQHIVNRYMSTLHEFHIKNDQKGLDFFIPDNSRFDPRQLPPLFHHGFISFVIGAGHFTKQMPDKKITQLINRINLPVLLLGGPDDFKKGEKIRINCGSKTYNLCGKLSIMQSASAVQQSTLVIAHDTGLMHIASAFKKVILSIWGNTIPAFGMYPYLPNPSSKIYQVEGLQCRPCSKIGYQKCPKKHFRCMQDIPIHSMADHAIRIFNQHQSLQSNETSNLLP